jgi:hypothetical protein
MPEKASGSLTLAGLENSAPGAMREQARSSPLREGPEGDFARRGREINEHLAQKTMRRDREVMSAAL